MLVPDTGFDGLVVRVAAKGISFADEGDTTTVSVGAGESWDALVRAAGEKQLWGIENLAGIPGTVGGAVVQNIGAYGAELSETFLWAETVQFPGGTQEKVDSQNAHFAYRTSVFKNHPTSIITRATFRLLRHAKPKRSYPDLQRAEKRNTPLETSEDIARAVRAIRSEKFPQTEGTAGSFFKNPIVSEAKGRELAEKFPGLPVFPAGSGKTKIPLAWILDKALGLKGYAHARVRLYEKQPLVFAVTEGATADEIEALAENVATKVKNATGLVLEREVETMRAFTA
jgi:UDP-N-acetylmuramate dehydrogenase